MSKLSYYGITGCENKLFVSYLSNIYQYVEYNNAQSVTKLITTGVPQGSILGPLLFLIYINDLPKVSAFFDMLMYTDDTTIYCNINQNVNEIVINAELEKVFTKPKQTSVIKDPVTFFLSHTTHEADLFLTDITFSDSIIIEAIKELSPNSAGGPDGIPASLLINCAEEIAPALKIIFSHSLSSSLIPTSFKEAVIIPVFKSGDKSLPSNYRPISLTSVLSKVIEKIIRKQVLTFLSLRGYLNNTQHGFRSGRSCLSALLDVYDNIMHMINNKSTVDMIYLDFSKAFDKVDHGILLHKLRDLGITGRLGLWFFHFLNNRQHYVRMPGGISQPHPVLSGVPQGTVLGPLLFLIMIIDIDKGISPSSKLVSFADDTRVYSCINDIEKCDQLQIDLNSVYDWAHVNNMFFNGQKFNYVSFNGSMTPCGSNVYTNPNMEIISPSMNILDLGIYMSGDCTFNYHISSL